MWPTLRRSPPRPRQTAVPRGRSATRPTAIRPDLVTAARLWANPSPKAPRSPTIQSEWFVMRSGQKRATFILVMILVMMVLSWLVNLAVVPRHQPGEGYARLVVIDSLDLGEKMFAPILFIPVFIPILRSVSYRKRDSLLLMIPIYAYIFAAKVCWRAAFLPYADWPLRPEQYPRAELVDSPLYGRQVHRIKYRQTRSARSVR